MTDPHPNSTYPTITRWFLRNGGRDGLHRQDLVAAGFKLITVRRWIDRMEDEGKLTRERTGREIRLTWIGETS